MTSPDVVEKLFTVTHLRELLSKLDVGAIVTACSIDIEPWPGTGLVCSIVLYEEEGCNGPDDGEEIAPDEPLTDVVSLTLAKKHRNHTQAIERKRS